MQRRCSGDSITETQSVGEEVGEILGLQRQAVAQAVFMKILVCQAKELGFYSKDNDVFTSFK